MFYKIKNNIPSLKYSLSKRRSDSLRSQKVVSSKLTIASTILATIAALISVWVAYKQFQLQEIQTTMQTEQAALAKAQSKFQILQSLPVLIVKRRAAKADKDMSELVVCGTKSEMRMVSGFKALWLSEFIRYSRVKPDIQRIHVALLYNDEDEDKEGVTWRSTSDSGGEQCVYASEPNLQSILNFMNINQDLTSKFAYWHRSEAMVIVHQRDGSGAEYLRHYLFSSEWHEEAQLVSEVEAAQWVSDYKSAFNMKRQAIISDSGTNLSYIRDFFR